MDELQLLNKQNQFITKTCLTTYTYSTTYIEDGTTKVESREKVISNTATEERNAYRIQPTAASGITLTQVTEFKLGCVQNLAFLVVILNLFFFLRLFILKIAYRLHIWAPAFSKQPTHI